MYHRPKNDVDYSLARLDAMMRRRRLSFNPYTVSDHRLIEIVNTVGWGNEFDIVEMVALRFTRLSPIDYSKSHRDIFITVGNSDEEIPLSGSLLTHGVTATDSNRKERFMFGKKQLRSDSDIEKLLGQSVFVSHIIRGTDFLGHEKSAYRMHKLTGKTERDAGIIRHAMCEAKIEMLERILKYPESPYHLWCVRGLFDYESRIRRAIEVISRFPNAPSK
ncbi:MAG: hypothetical protein K2K81_07470 [Muribaculaceae bacterium]|nr:hypothetical protein [Muribaculaceae bacterium]MDE6682158.1 hypothetical protein [Muribaculaceae bacterium]